MKRYFLLNALVLSGFSVLLSCSFVSASEQDRHPGFERREDFIESFHEWKKDRERPEDDPFAGSSAEPGTEQESAPEGETESQGWTGRETIYDSSENHMSTNELVYAEPGESFRIEDFPVIMQMPELPTGCEVTSLTMAMNYHGLDVSKEEMAADFLPTVAWDKKLIYDLDNHKIGPDLNKVFLGDPFSAGTVCGTDAICDAANDYCEAAGIEQTQAYDINGADPSQLYAIVRNNIPVVVWVTIDMERRYAPEDEWYTLEGSYVSWAVNDHAMVLIGYDDDIVVLADPLEGIVEYGRSEFETVFAERGSRSVIILNKE